MGFSESKPAADLGSATLTRCAAQPQNVSARRIAFAPYGATLALTEVLRLILVLDGLNEKLGERSLSARSFSSRELGGGNRLNRAALIDPAIELSPERCVRLRRLDRGEEQLE